MARSRLRTRKQAVMWHLLAASLDLRQQWARHSLAESVWANAYWQQTRPRCASDNHAYRCLGNRWLAIAWKLWQTGQAYDQDYHLQQRAKHTKANH